MKKSLRNFLGASNLKKTLCWNLLSDVDKQTESLISSGSDYVKAIRLLTTIPGVKHDSAITIISEIGIDMSQFCNSKCLCC